MDPAEVQAVITTIATVIKTAVDLTPSVIQVVDDAKPFAEAIYGIFTGTNVTQDQLTALEAQITALSAQLQEPLPPEDDGTST